MVCEQLPHPGAEPELKGHGAWSEDGALDLAVRPQQLILAVQEWAHHILQTSYLPLENLPDEQMRY